MTIHERLVPKIHPATREIEVDDPMELFATAAIGDPDVMFDCIVQEFAGLGWSEEQLAELFQSGAYPVLKQLRDDIGEAEVRRRLRDILTRRGSFRVRETIADPPEEDEIEPELIQITVRSRD